METVTCPRADCDRTTQVQGETWEEWHADAEAQGWVPMFRFEAVCPVCWRETLEECE